MNSKDKALLEKFLLKNQEVWLALKILGRLVFPLQPCWGGTPPSVKNWPNFHPAAAPPPPPTPLLRHTKILLSPDESLSFLYYFFKWEIKVQKPKMVTKIFKKKISQFFWRTFIKFSACGVHFDKDLQIMSMKVFCR